MKKKQKKLTVNLTMCRYKVVADCCNALGWTQTEDESAWNLFWTDLSVGEARCMKLKRLQKINHFPGMTEIAHKCKLARNLNRMRSKLPHFYNFHPETFNLPVDYKAFEKEIEALEGKNNKTYIVKPNDGACGVGIFLTRKLSTIDPKLKCVVQRYITRPLVIDSRKFDMRVYCLVTSMSPLRVYVYHEGLARFATEEYQKVTPQNMDKAYMHLTNYSVNKNHAEYEANKGTDDTSTGSKRSLDSIWRSLNDMGIDAGEVWQGMEKVIVKTLLAVQPYVQHTYKSCIPENRDSAGFTCFDLLGFDIMLDYRGKPWIIEVNEMPSFDTSAPIDLAVKTGVITETLRLVHSNPQPSHWP
jgi:tubulin polyglutamylase TTLL6/13